MRGGAGDNPEAYIARSWQGDVRDKMKSISADPAEMQHGNRAVGILCVHGSECTVAYDERPHFLQKAYGDGSYLESETSMVGMRGSE